MLVTVAFLMVVAKVFIALPWTTLSMRKTHRNTGFAWRLARIHWHRAITRTIRIGDL